jgi:hypothetical protein
LKKERRQKECCCQKSKIESSFGLAVLAAGGKKRGNNIFLAIFLNITKLYKKGIINFFFDTDNL